jgi:hypothetical protein
MSKVKETKPKNVKEEKKMVKKSPKVQFSRAPIPQFLLTSRSDTSHEGKKVIAMDDEEEKAEEEKLSLPRLLSMFGGTGNRHWRGTLFRLATVSTQNGDTKYLLGFNYGSAVTYLPVGIILANANGYTAVTSLYGEIFLHRVRCHYEPSQVTGGSLINSTATNLQDTPVIWGSVQHADTSVTDDGNAFSTMTAWPGSVISNIRKTTKFVWKNVEKFQWDGPLADHTTVVAGQGWFESGSVATKMGGAIYVSGYNACHTTPSNVLLPKNAQLGIVVLAFDISARVRVT